MARYIDTGDRPDNGGPAIAPVNARTNLIKAICNTVAHGEPLEDLRAIVIPDLDANLFLRATGLLAPMSPWSNCSPVSAMMMPTTITATSIARSRHV
jgi:hypothetical protein